MPLLTRLQACFGSALMFHTGETGVPQLGFGWANGVTHENGKEATSAVAQANISRVFHSFPWV
jgi:hypothetical protein